jgi:adenylate cyclase
MARLSLIEGKGEGDFRMVTPHGLTIGRLPSNEVCLPDEHVSRQHARVEYRRDACYIVDLGSSNGTKVNGVKIKEKALAPGDIITIGKNRLRFEDGNASKVELYDSPPVVPGNGTIVKSFDEVAATRSERHLRVLYDAGKALLSKSDLNGLLNLIMDLVFRELPAKRGFLLLLDDEGGLRPAVVRAGETGCSESVTISRTIAEKAQKEKVSVLTSDASIDPRFCSGASVFLYGIRSALCVPLLNEDEVMGVLYLDNRDIRFTERIGPPLRREHVGNRHQGAAAKARRGGATRLAHYPRRHRAYKAVAWRT